MQHNGLGVPLQHTTYFSCWIDFWGRCPSLYEILLLAHALFIAGCTICFQLSILLSCAHITCRVFSYFNVVTDVGVVEYNIYGGGGDGGGSCAGGSGGDNGENGDGCLGAVETLAGLSNKYSV